MTGAKAAPIELEGTIVEILSDDNVYLQHYGLLPPGWAVLEPLSGNIFSCAGGADVWPTFDEALQSLVEWNDYEY